MRGCAWARHTTRSITVKTWHDIRSSGYKPRVMSIGANEFKQVLRQWASGVSVVTACHEGAHHGMTVSAFNSVSVSPPLVSVCLASSARVAELLAASGRFAVSVLSSKQGPVSNHFASSKEEDRFVGQYFVAGVDGCRLLGGALAQLECNVVSSYEAGDHVIVIGEVQHARVDAGAPLLYFNGSYGDFQSQA